MYGRLRQHALQLHTSAITTREHEQHAPEQGPTPGLSCSSSSYPLQEGYQTWSIVLEPPADWWDPTQWHFAGRDRAQWSLAYPHGAFPPNITPNTAIRYAGASYLLLYAGSNTLRVQELRDEPYPLTESDLLVGDAQDTAAAAGGKQASTRRDNRVRQGRGRLRHEAAPLTLQEHVPGTPRARVCYTVPVSQLPLALSEKLHLSVGDDCDWRARSRYCYVQPFALQRETGTLVAWQSAVPGRAADTGGIPDYFKVALTPAALPGANAIEVSELEAADLVGALTDPATPSRIVRVAPASFLTEELRAMIAPEVSFLGAITGPGTDLRACEKQGDGVAIPQHIYKMRIEELGVSEHAAACLKKARIHTVGTLLEMEEDLLTASLDEGTLWEVHLAVWAKRILPTLSGVIPVAPAEESGAGQPVFAEFYYFLTGVSYDDREQGRLYLAHASVFADRLNGQRSGTVETIWLSRAQIGQSLRWERDLAHLDTHELRVRVNAHAVARGATQQSAVPADEASWERKRRESEREEMYNLVPLRHELFVSTEDLKSADARQQSPTSTVLHVLERYMRHPALQPVGDRLPLRVLEEMHAWIKEDRVRQFRELPHPASPTIIMHEVYVTRRLKVQDQAGRISVQDVPELTGYLLIIGVLASTPVPDQLIVKPRCEKPSYTAPVRPIMPQRIPNYVPIQAAA